MIRLVVEDYCHTCSKFKPQTDKLFGDNKMLLTEVTCKYRQQCENVARFVSALKAKGEHGE